MEEVEGVDALKTGVCRKRGNLGQAAAAVGRGHGRMLAHFGGCRTAKNGLAQRRRGRIGCNPPLSGEVAARRADGGGAGGTPYASALCPTPLPLHRLRRSPSPDGGGSRSPRLRVNRKPQCSWMLNQVQHDGVGDARSRECPSRSSSLGGLRVNRESLVFTRRRGDAEGLRQAQPERGGWARPLCVLCVSARTHAPPLGHDENEKGRSRSPALLFACPLNPLRFPIQSSPSAQTLVPRRPWSQQARRP